MTTIGTTIKKMRKARGLSVRKLAELSGVSHPYLSQIENGRNNASPTILIKLAKGLQCDYLFLLGVAGYERDEREQFIEELVSLNLWSARRLPKVHKEFAYGMLEELTNKKHERL